MELVRRNIPTFDEIKRFEEDLMPLIREYQGMGYTNYERMKNFLKAEKDRTLPPDYEADLVVSGTKIDVI